MAVSLVLMLRSTIAIVETAIR